MDETLIRLNAPVLKCWMKRGQQKSLPFFTGTRHSQMLTGALNWRTGHVHVRELVRLNSESIIAYFEWLFTEVYPTSLVVLVMDNASFHHSAAVQAALAHFGDRLLLVWLPPYSPDLNPIERFWKHLKANCANYLYPSLSALVAHVHRLVICQNQDGHPLQLSFSKSF